MKTWEIWSDYWVATGEYAPPSHMGTVEAETFDDAVEKIKEAHPYPELFRYVNGKHYYWLCELFENKSLTTDTVTCVNANKEKI